MIGFESNLVRNWGVVDELCVVLKNRKENPVQSSFVSSIILKPAKIAGKIAEESAEFEEAFLKKSDSEVVWEAADLFFFMLVALENRGIDFDKVLQVLEERRK